MVMVTVVRTSTVSSHMPRDFIRFVTLPRAASQKLVIPASARKPERTGRQPIESPQRQSGASYTSGGPDATMPGTVQQRLF